MFLVILIAFTTLFFFFSNPPCKIYQFNPLHATTFKPLRKNKARKIVHLYITLKDFVNKCLKIFVREKFWESFYDKKIFFF